MQMDHFEVEVGDSIHDMVFGAGVVDRLVPDQDKFWVRFGPNQLRCFGVDGKGNFPNRTLFWKNPVLTAPHKHDDSWDTAQEIHAQVSHILRRRK